MPTYQYACTEPSCANRFELVQSFTDPAVAECPVCASPVRKVYGSVGVVFKGSGFYRTDSRAAANGSTKPDGTKSDSAKSDGTKSDSTSDSASKPATKSESKAAPVSSGSSPSGSSGSGGSAGDKAAASA